VISKMETSVKAARKDNMLIVVMDDTVDRLRREIWKTIFKHKRSLSDYDVCMALGLVQYELINHTKGQISDVHIFLSEPTFFEIVDLSRLVHFRHKL